ncbi:MAG TPA: S28 family serine protease, partial [Flavobacteriaceae bacterium]|nr:S28 family serine protease [Flavobacteriaceae bacterium]
VEMQGYGIYTDKAGELAKHYKANQLTIEHRYFNNSRPKNIDWNTLTVKAAAKDQNYIITQICKALYPNANFITTGVSKGCQTTLAHGRYFPNAVEGSVCYVGPLNFSREDNRIYSFLKNVGTAQERAKITAFQIEAFKRKDYLLNKLKLISTENNYQWEMGIDKALTYSILEYPFAFWQWGNSTASIPTSSASDDDIYNHLFKVSGYGFFEENAVNNLQPYFWAALTEQGIYGYETAPFEKYIGSTKIYDFQWAFPEGIEKEFNPKAMQEIKTYLDTSAKKMLFIYGEYDAWSATAVELNNTANARELYKFVKEKGSHTTRIKSFSEEKQQEIYNIIDSWLAE